MPSENGRCTFNAPKSGSFIPPKIIGIHFTSITKIPGGTLLTKMPAELPSTEQIFVETNHLVPLIPRGLDFDLGAGKTTRFIFELLFAAMESCYCQKSIELEILVEFWKSMVEFWKSMVEFWKAMIEFWNAVVEFWKAMIEFLESNGGVASKHLQFPLASFQFSLARFQILASEYFKYLIIQFSSLILN